MLGSRNRLAALALVMLATPLGAQNGADGLTVGREMLAADNQSERAVVRARASAFSMKDAGPRMRHSNAAISDLAPAKSQVRSLNCRDVSRCAGPRYYAFGCSTVLLSTTPGFLERTSG
jgi:hypothetical protein